MYRSPLRAISSSTNAVAVSFDFRALCGFCRSMRRRHAGLHTKWSFLLVSRQAFFTTSDRALSLTQNWALLSVSQKKYVSAREFDFNRTVRHIFISMQLFGTTANFRNIFARNCFLSTTHNNRVTAKTGVDVISETGTKVESNNCSRTISQKAELCSNRDSEEIRSRIYVDPRVLKSQASHTVNGTIVTDRTVAAAVFSEANSDIVETKLHDDEQISQELALLINVTESERAGLCTNSPVNETSLSRSASPCVADPLMQRPHSQSYVTISNAAGPHAACIAEEAVLRTAQRTVAPRNDAPDWTWREVLITTCAEMWDDRPDGANFIVEYIDTGEGPAHGRGFTAAYQKRPCALVVEGCDGVDLRPLAEELVERGYRVIMPCLIGSGGTRAVSAGDGERFMHLLGERSSFLLDFMSAVRLDGVDVVVGHSFSCLPIVTLALNAELALFRSIALLSPIPAHDPPRWVRPMALNCRFLDWSHHALLWPITRLWLLAWVKSRLPVSPPAGQLMKRLHLLMEISLGINYDAMSSLTMVFRARRLPLLYVYCSKDALVSRSQHEGYAAALGLTPPPPRSTRESEEQDSTLIDDRSPLPQAGCSGRVLQLHDSPGFSAANPPEYQLVVDAIIELLYDKQRSKY